MTVCTVYTVQYQREINLIILTYCITEDTLSFFVQWMIYSELSHHSLYTYIYLIKSQDYSVVPLWAVFVVCTHPQFPQTGMKLVHKFLSVHKIPHHTLVFFLQDMSKNVSFLQYMYTLSICTQYCSCYCNCVLQWRH